MLIAVVSVSILIWLTLGLRESLHRLHRHPGDAGADAGGLLPLRLHAEPHHAVRADLLHRHPGGRRHRGGGEHRPPLRACRPTAAGRLCEVAVEAVDEVGNPTILATLTVIAAILPMAFVGGLMGPYMRPIPIGASAAMLFSLLVAFMVTPWAAVRLLKRRRGARPRRAGGPAHPPLPPRHGPAAAHARAALGLPGAWSRCCCSAPCALVYVEFVKVKMLPFDNKSEFQVIVDMPEGTTLEQTARVTRGTGRRRPDAARGGRTSRPTRARPRPTTSTAWCATTTCAAARTWPTSR